MVSSHTIIKKNFSRLIVLFCLMLLFASVIRAGSAVCEYCPNTIGVRLILNTGIVLKGYVSWDGNGYNALYRQTSPALHKSIADNKIQDFNSVNISKSYSRSRMDLSSDWIKLQNFALNSRYLGFDQKSKEAYDGRKDTFELYKDLTRTAQTYDVYLVVREDIKEIPKYAVAKIELEPQLPFKATEVGSLRKYSKNQIRMLQSRPRQKISVSDVFYEGGESYLFYGDEKSVLLFISHLRFLSRAQGQTIVGGISLNGVNIITQGLLRSTPPRKDVLAQLKTSEERNIASSLFKRLDFLKSESLVREPRHVRWIALGDKKREGTLTDRDKLEMKEIQDEGLTYSKSIQPDTNFFNELNLEFLGIIPFEDGRMED